MYTQQVWWKLTKAIVSQAKLLAVACESGPFIVFFLPDITLKDLKKKKKKIELFFSIQ